MYSQDSSKCVDDSSPPGHAMRLDSQPSVSWFGAEVGVHFPGKIPFWETLILCCDSDKKAAYCKEIASKTEGDIHQPSVRACEPSFWVNLQLRTHSLQVNMCVDNDPWQKVLAHSYGGLMTSKIAHTAELPLKLPKTKKVPP